MSLYTSPDYLVHSRHLRETLSKKKQGGLSTSLAQLPSLCLQQCVKATWESSIHPGQTHPVP